MADLSYYSPGQTQLLNDLKSHEEDAQNYSFAVEFELVVWS
jgi:hypothetical protein